MNKQQLANKIWESANKMRSKIEANDYKDYILGFIFYKFLSDKELRYLRELGATDAEIREELNESNADLVSELQDSIGYFISYDNLFSTWIAEGSDFGIENVRDALSAFSRLIGPRHKKVFVRWNFRDATDWAVETRGLRTIANQGGTRSDLPDQ